VWRVARTILGVVLAAFASGLVGLLFWYYEAPAGVATLPGVSSTASGCAPDGAERIYIPVNSMTPVVRDAFLAVEDPDFYDRPLTSPIVNFGKALVLGRDPHISPILDSVVRCLLASAHKESPVGTFEWKIDNVILADRIATALSKDDIFDIYLNNVWLGGQIYGIGGAARAYFDKSLGDLSIDEIAYIAGLPKAPSRFNRDREAGIDRRNVVIDKMMLAALLTSEEAAIAKQQPLRVRPLSVGR
jgi:penicillin-binding protein 1A